MANEDSGITQLDSPQTERARYRSDRRAELPFEADADDDRRQRSDRRATPRLEVELGLEEQVGAWRFFRTTADLSTFGVSTLQGSPHPVGTRVDLKLHLTDGLGALTMSAVVVGAREGDAGGLRLAFRDASADALKRIHRFVVSQSHATGEDTLGEDTTTKS